MFRPSFMAFRRFAAKPVFVGPAVFLQAQGPKRFITTFLSRPSTTNTQIFSRTTTVARQTGSFVQRNSTLRRGLLARFAPKTTGGLLGINGGVVGTPLLQAVRAFAAKARKAKKASGKKKKAKKGKKKKAKKAKKGRARRGGKGKKKKAGKRKARKSKRKTRNHKNKAGTKAASKASVFRGTKAKTAGGLAKEDLVKNKAGKIVSKRMSQAARARPGTKQILKWSEALKQARENLNVKGFEPCRKGSALYKEIKKIYSAA